MANFVAESKSNAARGRHAANSKNPKPVASLYLLHSTLGEPPFGAQTTGTWPTGYSYYGHNQIKIDPKVAHAAAHSLQLDHQTGIKTTTNRSAQCSNRRGENGETRWREAHRVMFGLRTILKSPRTALANAALPKALPTTALANAALPKESFSVFVVLYHPVVAGVSDP